MLKHVSAIELVAEYAQRVHAFDQSTQRVESILKGAPTAYRLPDLPRNVTPHIDELPELDDVAALILLDDVPLPRLSLLPGCKILGDESALRDALRGRKYFPLAYWREYAIMEITS